MRDGLLIVLMFALGVLLGRMWPEHPPAAATEAPVPATAAPHVDAQSDAPTPRPATLPATPTPPAAAATRPAPAAPPVGTPLAQALTALKARAEAGDAEAAMRWYREASTCALLAPAPRVGHRSPPRDAEVAAQRCLQTRHCASLSHGQLQPLQALRLAALAGNDDAAVAYASVSLLPWMSEPSTIAVLQQWPAEAPVLLARARERGHAWAWLVTAETLTAGQMSPSLRRVLPRDPTTGLAMLWALQQVPQPGFELVQAMQGNDWTQLATRLGVPDAALGAIRSEGDRLYQRQLRGISHLSAEIEASRRLTLPIPASLRSMLAEISPVCHAELAAHPRWRTPAASARPG